MILECPSCNARYLVQIGLFAQGGRQVRCARCKHEWFVKLPTSIDVVMPPDPPKEPPRPFATDWPSASPAEDVSPPPLPPMEATPNLPAVFDKWRMPKKIARIVIYVALAGMVLLPFVMRHQMVKAYPAMRMIYDSLGFKIVPLWDGLVFSDVKSELRYDSGTMRLFVAGKITNSTSDVRILPSIKARARGADGTVIQSWSLEPPAATIGPDASVPFHTEVATPMEHTIEDVNLEFYHRDENDGK